MKRPIQVLWDYDMGWIIEEYIDGQWEVQNLPMPGKKNQQIPWDEAIELANELNTTIRFYPNDSDESTGEAKVVDGMYYDEKIEDDKVYFRTEPYGKWHPMGPIDVTRRYKKVKEKKKELQQQVWETQEQLEMARDKIDHIKKQVANAAQKIQEIQP